MAVTDWVMVCSSGLIARAVTHSANRRNPGLVKAHAKAESKDCQRAQTSVACGMGRLLSRCHTGCDHPVGSARETSFSTAT
jgi:hypothetical protein